MTTIQYNTRKLQYLFLFPNVLHHREVAQIHLHYSQWTTVLCKKGYRYLHENSIQGTASILCILTKASTSMTAESVLERTYGHYLESRMHFVISAVYGQYYHHLPRQV